MKKILYKTNLNEYDLSCIVKKILSEDISELEPTYFFGDHIGFFVARILNFDDENNFCNRLDNKNNASNLISTLKGQEPNDNIENVIVSVGSSNLFKDFKNTSFICNLIKKLYPNANYYVIEGFLNEDKILEISENEFDDIENDRYNYYDEYKRNNFMVIKSGDLFLNQDYSIDNYQINKIADKINSIIHREKIDITPKNEITFDNDTYDTNLSDNIKDFDTVDKFYDRFEKIIKSNDKYSSENTSNSYNPDIHQVEIAIRFLLPNLIDVIKVDGVFDSQTENAIEDYQLIYGLNPTGILDLETLESLYESLNSKNFNDDDLKKYLEESEDSSEINLINGRVEIVGLSGEKETNAQLMIDILNDEGITNPFTQIGILSVIGKESGFIPQNEICYNNTSESRIKSIFGSCRTSDEKIKKDWSSKYGKTVTIGMIKNNCEDFFDAVYGPQASECFSFNTGNDNPGDGYKYRGRGFNGITFKSGYRKYSNIVGIDLVSNPDKLNDVNVAAEVAVKFFTQGNIPEFTNIDDSINYFVDKNAGGHGNSETRGNAFDYASNFEIVT